MTNQIIAFDRITFLKSIKAGLFSGLIAAAINNLWALVAQQLGCLPPSGFILTITVYSICPILVAGLIYYLLMKLGPKGELIFLALTTIVTLLSLYVPLSIQLKEQESVIKGFTLLTLPMHLFATVVAMWGIPKFASSHKLDVHKSTFDEVQIRRAA